MASFVRAAKVEKVAKKGLQRVVPQCEREQEQEEESGLAEARLLQSGWVRVASFRTPNASNAICNRFIFTLSTLN
jgi:hypothetical protein